MSNAAQPKTAPAGQNSAKIVQLPRRNGKVIVKAGHRRTINQVIAAVAAGFLPVASYVIAHIEAPTTAAYAMLGFEFRPLYLLVLAALVYSAPTLVKWADSWTHSPVKSVGFAVLLEGVMVFSHLLPLNLTGLFILVAINSTAAYGKAGK